ncbi:unnamed protein product [Echinostoma caproni]|uniref:Cadherin domain-containing protein n=1 Tax=Echinostoma caproni TaxID=27848 RepID=A0A183A653_9TREM|nr:unnamed protein product [Echinostoma caproni]
MQTLQSTLSASLCAPKGNQLAYICYIEEENTQITHLMDLTTTLGPSPEQLNGSAHSMRFILFPFSQPFYEYFTIVNSFFSSTHSNTAPFSQLLALKQPIDREKLCHSDQTQSIPPTTGLDDAIGHSFSDNNFVPTSQTVCICQRTFEWCSIYVQLALTPYQADARTSENVTHYPDISLNVMEVFFVEVRIVDVNDNAPEFLPGRYEVSISELEQVGTRYRLPSATDKDIGKNAQFVYRLADVQATIPVLHANQSGTRKNVSLQNDSQCFDLQSNMDSTELFIQLKQPLDREQYDTYYLLITAADMGSTMTHTGTLYVTVHVIDSNDRSPVFGRSQFVFHVSEHATPGTVIGQLFATDDDSGENGRITFDQQTEAGEHTARHGPAVNRFRVEPNSGQIRVHSPLDREQSKSVHFRVIARDHGQPVRMTTANVVIILHDVNDNNPIIRIWGQTEVSDPFGLLSNVSILNYSLLSSPGLSHAVGLSVSEALQPNSVIAFMDVYDPDFQENGDVSCTVQHASFDLQLITDYTKLLTTTRNLDRQSYGSDPTTSNQILMGTKAYQIVHTGYLDRESTPGLHVPIVCRDNGSQIVRSTTTLLYIQVSDINDNVPIFNLPVVYEPAVWSNKQQYEQWFLQTLPHSNDSTGMNESPMRMEIVLPESCFPNRTIVHFSAQDPDDSLNGLLEYELFMDSSTQNLGSDVRKETVNLLKIHTKTGHVSVQLPVWYASSSSSMWYHYTCLRRLTNSSWVVEPNPFTIDKITGVITNVRIIDRELDASQYRITVVAHDRGSPPKTSSLDVIVNILDQNDHAPRFRLPIQPCHLLGATNVERLSTTPSAFRTIMVSQTNQTLVQNLTHAFPELYSSYLATSSNPTSTMDDALQPIAEFSAFDPDDGVNGQVKYKLVSGCVQDRYPNTQPEVERTFSIDHSSGCLYLLRKIRFDEIGKKYTLRIVAQDGGAMDTSLSSFLDLSVAIRGLPDLYVELSVNVTTQIGPCSAQVDRNLSTMERKPVGNELSPTIRVLMSVTTVIGALLIVIIVILFIKQPAWFFGRRRSRTQDENNKMDMFQCHEVHNHIATGSQVSASNQPSATYFPELLQTEGGVSLLKADSDPTCTEYPVAVFTCFPTQSRQSSMIIRMESPGKGRHGDQEDTDDRFPQLITHHQHPPHHHHHHHNHNHNHNQHSNHYHSQCAILHSSCSPRDKINFVEENLAPHKDQTPCMKCQIEHTDRVVDDNDEGKDDEEAQEDDCESKII